MMTRTRRSMLFVPGNNPAMLQAAHVFDADALIFDLEDAVAPREKDAARLLVAEALNRLQFGRCERVVRINPLSTSHGQRDLQVILASHPDTILLPKAESDQIIELDQLISDLEEVHFRGKTQIIALLETALGVEEAYTCAKASSRLSGLFLGAEDLTADLGVSRTAQGQEIWYARCRVVMAARAAGVDSIDTPYTDVNDHDGLKADLQIGLGLGFTGKACINPRQVAVVHEALAPTPQAIDWARRVIAADIEAKHRGLGAISLDGKMIDAPIVKRAEHILALASLVGRSLREEGGRHV